MYQDRSGDYDDSHLRNRIHQILQDQINANLGGYGTSEGAYKGWMTRRRHLLGKGYGTNMGAKHNPWLHFLKQIRKQYPHITLHEAARLYHGGGVSVGGVLVGGAKKKKLDKLEKWYNCISKHHGPHIAKDYYYDGECHEKINPTLEQALVPYIPKIPRKRVIKRRRLTKMERQAAMEMSGINCGEMETYNPYKRKCVNTKRYLAGKKAAKKNEYIKCLHKLHKAQVCRQNAKLREYEKMSLATKKKLGGSYYLE